MAFSDKDIAPLWHNGPSPGAFYHFPGSQYGTGGFQKSHNLTVLTYICSTFHRAPITTGTSVVGIQFKDGIVIAADILGSYGSLARYRNLERLMVVNENIILGASGDYADFQCIKSYIERKM
ncbi:Proteasome subunit beta type-4 [Ooceraea biroi]|uniref:Proteasome subunit beta type-4 n=1 Tax=Ooceraea biroi TaxID=2015173 RepID=A0A026WAF7_OOCBI|nr:Proteasome subunit beta type-4 [Ooceraea biroi]EZA52968.1 Proteasome subunit beta type-4 [Ooceraea biroi]